MAEEDTRKKRVAVESLGWLTESTIMPKKHRAIAGVGPSSIVQLKAELYKSQEESKKSRELAGPDVNFHRAKPKLSAADPFSQKNSGVDARAHKYAFPSLIRFCSFVCYFIHLIWISEEIMFSQLYVKWSINSGCLLL